jgi:hypothetical protein
MQLHCGDDRSSLRQGRSDLSGIRRGRKTTKIMLFRPKRPRRSGIIIRYFNSLRENSLLSGSMEDQWNFFADLRILRALTIE